MVLGRLIRSLGLSKAQSNQDQSEPEVPAQEEDHSDQATDSDDENNSEMSGPSMSSPESSSVTGEVYPKMLLVQFRAANRDRDACPSAIIKQYSTRSIADLEEPSTASTPICVETPSQGLDALAPTSGSWLAAMRQKKNSEDPSSADDERVTRKACSILNKLTVEKFDSLFEQLATCGISKPKHLEMLMVEVFNKATTQHHFIPMYADLCVRLDHDTRISSVVEAGSGQQSFRRLLLNQCQKSFEKLLQPDADNADVDEEYRLRRKQQALGNIKLIGQLLVHGIVMSKLLVECSEELLRCRDTCPDALESLCALISVAGKQFDTSSWQFHPQLLEVFSKMRKLAKDKAQQARVRFLLRDVLDVRDAGWSNCTYKAATATANAPMKLEEVRETATQEPKYMCLEDQIETDNLLAGLMNISHTAAAKKKNNTPVANSAAPWRKKTPKNENNGKNDFCFSKDSAKGDESPKSQESPKAETQGRKGAKNKGSSPVAAAAESSPAFEVVSFRRALAAILADLATDKNVPAAVRRMRLQDVPIQFQTKEFVDILTRAVEERRGPIRRCALAFAAGLAAAEGQSAFSRENCLEGIGLFFKEVYDDLCGEIPRLPAIATSELLPTLRNVFSPDELNTRLPASLRSESPRA